MSGDRKIGRPARHPLERFVENCTRQPDGCVIWTGTYSSDGDGYGTFKVPGKLWRAHRWAYEQFVGPIPAGLTIDHLCRNRACVNPEHLEAVTNRENVLRGVGVSAENARKIHCKRGHLLDGRDGTFRRCLTCHRENQRRYLERKRAAA